MLAAGMKPAKLHLQYSTAKRQLFWKHSAAYLRAEGFDVPEPDYGDQVRPDYSPIRARPTETLPAIDSDMALRALASRFRTETATSLYGFTKKERSDLATRLIEQEGIPTEKIIRINVVDLLYCDPPTEDIEQHQREIIYLAITGEREIPEYKRQDIDHYLDQHLKNNPPAIFILEGYDQLPREYHVEDLVELPPGWHYLDYITGGQLRGYAANIFFSVTR